MRLIKEIHYLTKAGCKDAAAQIELTYADTEDGSELIAAKLFAFEFGSFALEGRTKLQGFQYFQTAPIERTTGNIIQFPTAKIEDATQ